MKFKEILSRLTGISSPIFGIAWSPVEADIERARKIIAFLEDRRVLYVPSEIEVPSHCVHSVLEIRHFLTSELAGLNSDSELAKNLRAMRAACRKFLDTAQDDERRIERFGGQFNHWASWIFNGALGELRGVFGIHIAQLAAQHGLDVEDQLASILPAKDDSE